jgi:hypothetical protein
MSPEPDGRANSPMLLSSPAAEWTRISILSFMMNANERLQETKWKA